MAVYGAGFRFKSQEARDFADSGEYPWKQVHDDLLHECLIQDNVVAVWRKDAEPGTLPRVEVPDLERLDYSCIAGVEQITMEVRKNGSITDDIRADIGDALWDAIKFGRRLTIRKGDDACKLDFAVLKTGKSNSPLAAPSMTGVLDDLDYIEAIKVGDWNGAWARRELIRHTKKGYSITSGPNAGTKRTEAKNAELTAIANAMAKIMGKQDLATNFDQTVEWLIFPEDHWSEQHTRDARQRLIAYAGVFALTLFNTESQADGMYEALMDRMRTEVITFRENFGEFLSREIFGSPTFLASFPDAPRMEPTWSVKPLYSIKSFLSLVAAYSNGLVSPITLRGMADFDDAEESARMMTAHENRKAYTPPHEQKQGLLPALFPDDYPGTPAKVAPDPESAAS
jgi:hypothetical protein